MVLHAWTVRWKSFLICDFNTAQIGQLFYYSAFSSLAIATLGNYWRVDVSLIPEDKLRRQNTSVSRNVDSGLSYASGIRKKYLVKLQKSDLNDVFYLASGRIKRKFDKEQLNSMTGLEPVLFQPSDPYSHIQHPYYEENSAPLIQQVRALPWGRSIKFAVFA